MNTELEKITNFWNWFSDNELNVRNISHGDSFVEVFESQLLKISIRAWEIGPSDKEVHGIFLAFPLTNDEQHNAYLQKVIDKAPVIEGWDFLVGLPPKKWSRKILWGPSLKEIDAKDWSFHIKSYPDGLHEIILLYDRKLMHLHKNIKDIAYAVVENELGQRLMLDSVYCVDVQRVKSIKSLPHLIPISELRRSLEISAAKKRIH